MSTIVRPRRGRRALRIRHNLIAALGVIVGGAVLNVLLPEGLVKSQRTSTLLGYASLGFLLLTLSIGPRNVLQGHRNPVSNDLRRDFGMWTMATGVAHVVFSLQHHFGGNVAKYFFESGSPSLGGLRTDAFGAGVYVGTAATLVLVGLAAISNDRSLRRLGRHRWKTFQRSNYLLAVLVVLHTLAFWVANSRARRVEVPVGLAILFVGLLQLAGVARHRQLPVPEAT